MQSKSQIRSIGIDLGKTTFHLVALGSRCQVVVRKKFSRSQRLVYTANLPSSLIGMEAGVGFLGRALREQGHEVRPMPAQFVRPFVKSNKNDYRDAEAIAEAVERENMRFVPHPDRRSARPASTASGARAVGVATNQRDQSDSSVSVGARHQLRERASSPASGDPGDSGECRRKAEHAQAPPVGFSLAGMETPAAADREFK
jgi:transposase